MSQQSNILVIGTTNRLDLVDPAALRPGRLDVQVEIALPDAPGRYDILRLHCRALEASGALTLGDAERALRSSRREDGQLLRRGARGRRAGGPADQSLDRSGDAAFVEARDACLAAAAAVSAAAATAPAADRKKSLGSWARRRGQAPLADAVLDAAPDLAFQRAVDAAHFAGRDLELA
ncbi:hypothetical protein JL721_10544 [Aureococcus anophagefferens]|nr:hypothetical protein JL721_10544 [Aureococcus anophagefferens]